MSDNEEEMSNNDSILNSVKTEPSDILNDSMEHHRNSFPALLGIPGNLIEVNLASFIFFFLDKRIVTLSRSKLIFFERDIASYFLFRDWRPECEWPETGLWLWSYLILTGLIPGPSGIHAANQDPNYGKWSETNDSILDSVFITYS